MTNLEQTLLREISTLPESRRADVLAFVRFLKIDLVDGEVEKRFDKALKSIFVRAKEQNITQADIEAEICFVRDGK